MIETCLRELQEEMTTTAQVPTPDQVAQYLHLMEVLKTRVTAIYKQWHELGCRCEYHWQIREHWNNLEKWWIENDSIGVTISTDSTGLTQDVCHFPISLLYVEEADLHDAVCKAFLTYSQAEGGPSCLPQ